MRLDKLLAETILDLIDRQTHKLLGAIQDGRVVLGGSAGSAGGVGDPPAGFWGQLRQANVTFDTAGSRPCASGSAGSYSLVDNLDRIRLGWEICDDAINEDHVDWGHGAGQVSAVDVPFQTTSGSIDATNVRDAIEETYAEGDGGGANTLDQAYDEGGAGAGRIIIADSGAVEIQNTGGLLSQGNIVLDDGAGDSPELQFVGGSNDDTAKIWLADDATSGWSDIIVRLPGTTANSHFIVEESDGTDLLRVKGAGFVQLPSAHLYIDNGYLRNQYTGEPTGEFTIYTAETNTAKEALRVYHESTQNAAAGFGVRLGFELDGDTSTNQHAAAIDAVWDDPASGSEDSRLQFLTRTGGAALAEIARMDGATGLIVASGIKVTDGLSHLRRSTTEPAARVVFWDSTTDDVAEVLRLYRTLAAGGAQAGLGGRCTWALPDDGDTEEDAGAIDVAWSDPAAASEDSYMAFLVRVAGAALAEMCRIDGTGLVAASGKDVYGDGDGSGLFTRNVDHWFSPTDHFNAFSGWTWAADAPFDGAPSTAEVTTYPSVLNLINDDITEDHFAYKSTAAASVLVTARLTKGAGSYVGIRIDDGDDDDFAEIRLVDSVAYPGMFRLQCRSDVGGAGVTTTYYSDPLPPAFYVLRLAWSDANNWGLYYITKDSPIPVYLGAHTGLTWTASRYGIIFGQRVAASDQGRAGLVDWFEYIT